MKLRKLLYIALCCTLSMGFNPTHSLGQFVPIGDGSYTTNFPGTDAAGRNSFPSGSPLLTGAAANKPAPTNDWWSAKIKNGHVDNLFNYPFTMKTVNSGLVVTYIPWGVIDNIEPVVVGVEGLNAPQALVSDFSDWTVSMDWSNGSHQFEATSGIGMPFLYFKKNTNDLAKITVNQGTVSISGEMLIITDARNGADFAVYGPVGSVWNQNGNTYTSSLNGNNYWSLAFIPLTASNVTAVANEYKKYAYVFPTNTKTVWDYDETSSVLRTDFMVETEVLEGNDSSILMGLLPHQWAHLASNSPSPDKYSYQTVRGELKCLEGNTFSTENRFYGILPTLPFLDFYNPGFSPGQLNSKVQALKNDQLDTWTDSYNEGQLMNRLIQTARIADLMGDTLVRDQLKNTVKTRLEDWLSASPGEVAFLFYYNSNWSAMLGYPAGHGQDGNINDHHFHWGYFIHAASFVEQYEPGWASQWGDMIDLLVRDAASPNRDDTHFPFLRNFSPYAGHCWANGFASFPQGNDQESTSESMQFNSSLIHWGSVTGNDSIRDLGIYLYTTEQTAIEEYWLDVSERNFGPNQIYSLVSRVWGNSYDNGTFWTNDLAASYGIELYPIHGGSLYLGQDTAYVRKLWNEIETNTGILNNEVNPNLWHDIYWEYLAFIDPAKAISLYDSYPDRQLKFGVSDAQTYHWLHSMKVLGRVDISVTSDHPLAAVFQQNGEKIYVAQNYGMSPMTVNFSDGFSLNVPPQKLATSKDINLTGNLSSVFDQAYAGGSITLTATVKGGTATKIEFVDGETVLGQTTQAPYEFKASNLSVGRHYFYARIYDGTDFSITNLVEVTVGEQLPFLGDPIAIPGTFDAGHYDFYEGGIGQDIAYNDLSNGNAGDFRTEEKVDASLNGSEGATVGFISPAEWLEYSIDVAQAGLHELSFRYASGNTNGGGPFHLEMDGEQIGPNITVSGTGSWSTWGTKTVSNVPLKSGKNILRVFFDQGEFNLGKMTFTYTAPLNYDQPIANAGGNKLVVLPQTSTSLDGSNSSDPGGANLSYSWKQIYGPSLLTISNDQTATPSISPLEEGVYLMELTVSNGQYTDKDEVYVISSPNNNVPPKVSIYSPFDESEFIEGDEVSISATASDLIGFVQKVDFYTDNQLIGTSTQAPYQINWTPAPGDYSITATAVDDGGSQTQSKPISIKVSDAPPCKGTSYNGDFDYEFSDDDNNPTLTFIPSQNGVGTPTCILYYGTNANNLPGYGVQPNVPFRLNASKGETIYFYYTYSFPGAVEKNNAANKDVYQIGSCLLPTSIEAKGLELKYYPNPISNVLNLELPNGQNEIEVFSTSGKLMDKFKATGGLSTHNMHSYPKGLYIFRVKNGSKMKMFKVVK
ncbi:MAG: glycosyl hydrolase [Bacteroidia bacterium]|nr:glycosyl hydrolase [Bacteroidia bacterium]